MMSSSFCSYDVKQRARLAFTLLEALVVVAVVAVIAALVLPLLSAGRGMANNVKCANNLRQIGAGLFAYAGDRNGALVPAAVIRSNYFWFDELNPYMGFPQYTSSYPYPGPTASDAAFPLEWQLCPAQRERAPARQAVGYGWNYQNFGYKAANATFNSHSNLRQISEPARTIIIGDSKDAEVNPGVDSEYRYLYPKDGPPLAVRHRGRGNYLLLDGRVEALEPREIPAQSLLWKKHKQ